MRVAGALLLAAALLAIGCKKKRAEEPPPRPEDAGTAVTASPAPSEQVAVIRQVVLRLADSGDHLDSQELAKALGRQLTVSPLFVSEEEGSAGGPGARPVEIEVQLSYDVVEATIDGSESLLTTIEARVRFLDSLPTLPVQENIVLERPLERGDRDRLPALIVELADQAISAAGRGLIAKEGLRRAPDAEVIAAMTADDDDTIAWALTIAGDRKLPEVLDSATEALNSERAVVRDAAFVALVALGDPRAVDALAQKVDFRDYDQVRATIEAVSAIGGSDAAEFLEFVASGHPDPGIRRRATEALERVSSAAGSDPGR